MVIDKLQLESYNFGFYVQFALIMNEIRKV